MSVRNVELARGGRRELMSGTGSMLRGMLFFGVALVPVLVPALVASAGASAYNWTGEAASGSGWSDAGDWQGGVAPSPPGPVSLEFPRLSGCVGTCYESKNDIGGLSVESLTIDDGDDYKLTGDGIALGAGGLTASPESGTTGSDGDVLGMPIELGATQAWSISQRSGEPIGENGVALYGNVTGPGYGLKIDLHDGPVTYFDDRLEVERLAVENPDHGAYGLLDLQGAELNAAGAPVELSHAFLLGFGALGGLKTNSVGIGVGMPRIPALGIETSSVAFDPGSEVEFYVTGSGLEPGRDYSQLLSKGAVSLGGSKLYVYVYPPNKTGTCPMPAVGQTYTLIETAGALTGAFDNAPEGSEISIGSAGVCGSPAPWYGRALRIAYHESGAVQTATATVTDGPLAKPTGESTSTSPGAIEPLPVNPQIEKEFHEHPPWAKTSAAKSTSDIELLTGATLKIRHGHVASVRLDCAASGTCSGRLILTVETTSRTKTGKERSRMRTVTIGTAPFSIAAGKTATVEVVLNATGREMLRRDHGRLNAHVTIESAVPSVVK